MTTSQPTRDRDGATAERDAETAGPEAQSGERDASGGDGGDAADEATEVVGPDGGDGPADATPEPRIDAAESGALFVCAVLAGGAWAVVSGDGVGALSGLFGGGGVGLLLARLRLRFAAVRTRDGVERRRRPADAALGDQLNEWEYDPVYDRLLAAALAVVGAASFAAVALLDAPDGVLLRAVIVGHVSLVAALLVYGVSHRD